MANIWHNIDPSRIQPDDTEALMLHLRTDCLEYERELMDNRNYDLLSALKVSTKTFRAVCPCHKVGKTLECSYVVTDLLVKIDSICNDDNTIHKGLSTIEQTYKLISKPSD